MVVRLLTNFRTFKNYSQPASAFMPSSLPVLRHMRLAPVAASTPNADQRTGLWGLGRLLNRFRVKSSKPSSG